MYGPAAHQQPYEPPEPDDCVACSLCDEPIRCESTTTGDLGPSNLCRECMDGFRFIFGINAPSLSLPPLARKMGEAVIKLPGENSGKRDNAVKAMEYSR